MLPDELWQVTPRLASKILKGRRKAQQQLAWDIAALVPAALGGKLKPLDEMLNGETSGNGIGFDELEAMTENKPVEMEPETAATIKAQMRERLKAMGEMGLANGLL